MSSEIKVDTISEKTSANGVAIDSVTLKDGEVVGAILTDYVEKDVAVTSGTTLTIDLANGDGNTTISCEQPSNGTATLKVKVGTSTGNYDLQGTFATSATVAAASRYFLLFELTEGGDDVEFEAEDRTISFANNSVSPSTAPEINVIVGPER